MDRHDVLVVGAGISGLSFAWRAACGGRRVLVIEEQSDVGGCIRSHRRPDGFWFEMGAHTAYNSYAGFLEMAEATGAVRQMVRRGPARAHFGLLQDNSYTWLTPPKVLLQLSWLEAALHFPVGFFRSKAGQTIESYYSRLVGPRNYRRVLAPFLAAVPSQSADNIPVSGPGSLFKSRPRRKDLPRSYGFHGGLQTVCDAIAATPGIEIRTGVVASRLRREDEAFLLTCRDGSEHLAAVAALAAPPDAAASLLRDGFPRLSRAVGAIGTVGVESLGLVLPRKRCWLPECAFVVGAGDVFHSCVTRDPFPDHLRRSFAFHFKPGLTREQKLHRASEVLRVEATEFEDIVEAGYTLPSPVLGHERLLREIDRSLEGSRLAVTGNYFAGLAIEDCVQRSFEEWRRVSRG